MEGLNYDGTLELVYLYHPTLAPKGRRFYTDELPDSEDGWVDTPAKFPGYVKPEPVELDRLPQRPAAEPRWMYHSIEGGKVFMTDALPSEADGWFDTPARVHEWQPGKSADREAANESALNAFMAAWVAERIKPEMAPTDKGAVKKAGIAAWALETHKATLDTSQRLDEVLAAALAL